jgi:ATP-dependent RNA helicase DHX8/PRP22
VKNLDRLIVTMHPKYKRKAAKAKAAAAKANGVKIEDDEVKQFHARKFPGLSLPDQGWQPEDKFLATREGKDVDDKLPASISVDETMAELAAVAARRNRPAAEDFLDGEPSLKRQRYDAGSSNGHSREGGGERDTRRDDGYASKREGFTLREDGHGGQNGYGRDSGYGGRVGNGYGGDRGRPGLNLDERPVLYKIYNGAVLNIREFGAFVLLEGVQGRVEGGYSRALL